MNFPLLIAKRILSGRGEPGRDGTGRFSRPIVRISVIGIALGLAVMILTVAVVSGFQKEIREKVIGFGAHIQVANFDNNESYEYTPIKRDQRFVKTLEQEEGIRHVQVFAAKAGILKANDEIHGVVVKGVGSDFDWTFFSNALVEGTVFSVSDTGTTDNTIISRYIATHLKIKLGDKVPVYFIQDNKQRVRKFTVCGIYETGLGQQFDEVFMLADIGHLQKLNGWDKSQVAGFEVLINDFYDIDRLTSVVNGAIGFKLHARNIKMQNAQVFAWLNAQDINAEIVIILMLIVSSINMISALLILILERTNMIGILKALGSTDWSIRKIFLYNAAYLIGKGLLWGNVIALTVCFAQKQFGIFTLNPESYFVSQVPVNINALHVILLNLGTMVVCVLMLLLPSYIITRITPVKAIRFS
jgi:lipoprotein-releasing system permease protein